MVGRTTKHTPTGMPKPFKSEHVSKMVGRASGRDHVKDPPHTSSMKSTFNEKRQKNS